MCFVRRGTAVRNRSSRERGERPSNTVSTGASAPRSNGWSSASPPSARLDHTPSQVSRWLKCMVPPGSALLVDTDPDPRAFLAPFSTIWGRELAGRARKGRAATLLYGKDVDRVHGCPD